MAAKPPVVTLSSDFGQGSPYVAAMKAVVLAACPEAVLVDIGHSIPAFDVGAGGFLVWAGTRDFGAGAIHLAVVDPGVGSARRALIVDVDGRKFVAPDNGLLDVVLAEASGPAQAFELPRPAGASPTFEGRDVFAPAAGALAAGAEPGALGAEVEIGSLVRPPDQGPRVVWVDRFGNLVLNLRGPARPLRIGEAAVSSVARTYSEAPPGIPFVYVGSLGRLEVGVSRGRADAVLAAATGTTVEELPGP